MSSSFTNITVVGATGNLGPFIVQGLLQAKKFNVSVLTRSDSTSANTLPSAVKVVSTDYTAESLASALVDQDAIVIAISGPAEIHKTVIEAAAKAGVKRIMLSEFGNDMTNPAQVMDVPMYLQKVDVLNYTKELLKLYPQTSYTGLINGSFFDWCLKQSVFGHDLNKHHAVIYDNGTAEFDTTTLSTVGAAAASILAKADQYANEFVFIHSFVTSQNQILEALKKITPSDKPWTIEHRSAETYIAEGRDKIKQGNMFGNFDMLFGITFEEGHGQAYSKTKTLSNKDLELPVEDFDQVVREVVASDRHKVQW